MGDVDELAPAKPSQRDVVFGAWGPSLSQMVPMLHTCAVHLQPLAIGHGKGKGKGKRNGSGTDAVTDVVTYAVAITASTRTTSTSTTTTTRHAPFLFTSKRCLMYNSTIERSTYA